MNPREFDGKEKETPDYEKARRFPCFKCAAIKSETNEAFGAACDECDV